jgi:hypothetical protein
MREQPLGGGHGAWVSWRSARTGSRGGQMTEEPDFTQEADFEEELVEDLPELDIEDEDFAGEGDEELADLE